MEIRERGVWAQFSGRPRGIEVTVSVDREIICCDRELLGFHISRLAALPFASMRRVVETRVQGFSWLELYNKEDKLAFKIQPKDPNRWKQEFRKHDIEITESGGPFLNRASAATFSIFAWVVLALLGMILALVGYGFIALHIR